MKRIAFLFCFFISALPAMAQTPAVTSNGDEVVLYDDGTWKYTKRTDSADYIIDTNKIVFLKDKGAGFLLKSNITDIGIYLNPKKWSFKKGEKDGDAEYSFQLKGKDAYAMVLVERIEVPLESLKNIALENAKDVAPDVKIVKEEYRNVNGITVLCMQMNGTIKGIKFSYLGYYFSFGKGSVQFITYTSQNLLNGYKPELEELLNGFVLL